MPTNVEIAPHKEPGMRKQAASLRQFSPHPALPVLPAKSRCLVRP